MPAGFPVKANYATGDVLTAANLNDMAATLNYLDPTAKGDLFPASDASTLTRLAVGTNGEVLTADSTTATGLKWATPSSGSMTEIASGSLSGSAVNLTSIPGTYKNLQIVIRGFRPTADGSSLAMRINNDSTASRYEMTSTGNALNATAFSSSYFLITGGQDDTATNALIIINIPDYANTSAWKITQTDNFTNNSTTSTQFNYRSRVGAYNQTGAVTEVNLFVPSDTFTAGSYILYGVK